MKYEKGDRIWFTSDIHYGHKNLVRGVSDWEDKSGCRDFATVDEMNEKILLNINQSVQQDDTLFVLGDWSFAGIDNTWKLRNRINCRNIHFIIGNHDVHIKLDKMLHNDTLFRRAKELFTSVNNYLEISIEKQPIVMSHYPMAAWNNSFRGSWMLHGHCHDTLTHTSHQQWYGSDYLFTSGKVLDVGLDTAKRILGEYRPFSFKEIQSIMRDRKVVVVDHHTRETMSP